MRRFSQRSHLVTLNDINITPLLDLAFVLLIIFMITAPLLDQGITLPQGGQKDPPLSRSDYMTLELIQRNRYKFEGVEVNARQLWERLTAAKEANPSVIIFIRADQNTPFQEVFEVADFCAKLSLNLSFRSEDRTDKR